MKLIQRQRKRARKKIKTREQKYIYRYTAKPSNLCTHLEKRRMKRRGGTRRNAEQTLTFNRNGVNDRHSSEQKVTMGRGRGGEDVSGKEKGWGHCRSGRLNPWNTGNGSKGTRQQAARSDASGARAGAAEATTRWPELSPVQPEENDNTLWSLLQLRTKGRAASSVATKEAKETRQHANGESKAITQSEV